MTVRILKGDCRDVLKGLPDESVHCVVTSDFGTTICDCYIMSEPSLWSTANGGKSRPIHHLHEMADPNARLIAAAPDMLAVLQIISTSPGYEPVDGTRSASVILHIDVLRQMRAAIAKATTP